MGEERLAVLHRLTLGHLDVAAVERRQAVPTKLLDMGIVTRLIGELGERDAEGHATLGGCRVEFQNASVSCLWKSARTNRVAEEFALRLQRETGCVIADIGGYRVIDPSELSGLSAVDTSQRA
jgi:hypothetical protein